MFLIVMGQYIQAQELNIKVSVQTPAIKKADPELFTQMEQAISDFLNNTRWTSKTYEPHEKIVGTIQLTITEEYSATSFAADFIIGVSRPVYETSYTSPLISHLDKGMPFTYTFNQPIERSEDNFNDYLSSVLTFYAYLVLGLDADSFEPFGGTEYFQTALNVYNALPTGLKTNDAGWGTSNDQNRYWILENILNPRMRPFRQAFYEYHRLGLDMMTNDRGKARAVIASNITTLDDVNRTFPNSMMLIVFGNSKREELVQLFEVAPPGQKKKIYDIMVSINPILAEALKSLKL